MNTTNKLRGGASADAILLTFIKLVTTALGLVITRLLSQYLSVHDYGTYSQILLIVSTVSSITIFGMMDGMNYFYCSVKDVEKRESYVSTIYALQCVIGAIAGCVVLALTTPLCSYFNNPDVKYLLGFAAIMPVLQNLLAISQILLVSVGKARMLAIRNFVISLVRLAAVFVVIAVVQNVAVVLTASVLLELGQIVFFWLILHKSNCYIRLSRINLRLLKEIMRYCAPMAVFMLVSTLNRDMDKYLISAMTNTETLAIYANASRPLPFDIIMASFCTVLIPHITRYISQKENEEAERLYKLFLEITYITTGILCCAAIAAAPQLMQLLYSNKYTEGLAIFCIYILVDLFRFTNITLVLSAAGKAKQLMILGVGAMMLNALLNVLFYNVMGIIGPAVVTLMVTLIVGVIMMHLSAKVLETHLQSFFDLKYLTLFVLESLVLTFAMSRFRVFLEEKNVHYFVILVIVAGVYGITMLLLNGKRLLSALKKVNRIKTL